jgi:hypothetical protein
LPSCVPAPAPSPTSRLDPEPSNFASPHRAESQSRHAHHQFAFPPSLASARLFQAPEAYQQHPVRVTSSQDNVQTSQSFATPHCQPQLRAPVPSCIPRSPANFDEVFEFAHDPAFVPRDIAQDQSRPSAQIDPISFA